MRHDTFSFFASSVLAYFVSIHFYNGSLHTWIIHYTYLYYTYLYYTYLYCWHKTKAKYIWPFLASHFFLIAIIYTFWTQHISTSGNYRNHFLMWCDVLDEDQMILKVFEESCCDINLWINVLQQWRHS